MAPNMPKEPQAVILLTHPSNIRPALPPTETYKALKTTAGFQHSHYGPEITTA